MAHAEKKSTLVQSVRVRAVVRHHQCNKLIELREQKVVCKSLRRRNIAKLFCNFERSQKGE